MIKVMNFKCNACARNKIKFFCHVYIVLSFQAVGCALYVLGFGESVASLVGWNSPWAERGFAGAAVLLLGLINVAGVKWVVKLQFILLLILLLAGVDFVVGSFIHTDKGEALDVTFQFVGIFYIFAMLCVPVVTPPVNVLHLLAYKSHLSETRTVTYT